MTTPLIPIDVLLGNPNRTAAQISPDGTRISWLGPDEGVLNVWVAPVDNPEAATVVTKDRDRGIRSYAWAFDNTHLLYLQDLGGDENWQLFVVDLDTGNVELATPFDGIQAQIVGRSYLKPDTILVGINKDNPQLHDVYELTLSTLELVKVCENRGYIAWVADHNLVIRCAIAPRPDGGYSILARDSADAEWRTLLGVDHEDSLGLDIEGFDATGTKLVVASPANANASRLLSIDLATGEQTLIYGHPKYDISAVGTHPTSHAVQVVTYVADRINRVVLDPALVGDIEKLDEEFAGDDWSVVSRELSDATWLIARTSSHASPSYYSYDRVGGSVTKLFDVQPELNDYELAPMTSFTFKARDGLEVQGYLTLPLETDGPAKAVLNVHGGPWHRDTWGLNSEAQWLANRGYACVQINYRGSTGFGKDFVNAGDRAWAAECHDDLLDGLDYLSGLGLIDGDQVAIYGGSYGGYAALVGMTFTPTRFVCGVDIVGPSNLKTLIESVPEYWAPLVAQFHKRVGNPDTEANFLWSRSPLSKVDQIVRPLLIAQGANDPRVKQAESEQIVAAMTERGIDHEYMLFPDEGHGFAKPENRLRFYAAAEQFLGEHLGGR